jgi:DNA polymerase-3 subunit alpha
MAALISSVMNTKDRVPIYVNACAEMGIEVLPPDVNFSQCDFAVVEGKIRFGLNAVKNVGDTAARAIVAAREADGPFESLWDFTARVDPSVANKRALESLVKCGAFDSTGATRRGMFEALENALSYGQRAHGDRLIGQDSLFGGMDEKPSHPPIGTQEWEKNDLLRLEKETLGLYVSEHPLTAVRDQLRRKTECGLADIDKRRDGEVVTVGGIVSSVRQLTTKKGDPMAFLQLEDTTGGAECVVFNSTYAHSRELCVADQILIVKARIDHKEGETKLIALDVAAFEAVAERKDVRLKIDARLAKAGVIRELAQLVKEFQGAAPVLIEMETSQGSKTLELGPDYRVEPAADFFAEVKQLLGPAGVL